MNKSPSIDREKIDMALLCWNNRVSFNCWGFVAAYLGWVDQLKWLTASEMTEFLSKCQPVDELQAGDIIAYYSKEGWLVHTALYAGDGYCYHKRGSAEFEFVKADEVWDAYAEYNLKEEVLLRTA